MKTLLTPVLLDYLTGQGYHYCLIKADRIRTAAVDLLITLIPVKSRPGQLPAAYDGCFSIDQEPVQMADGLDGVIPMVQLKPDEFPDYISFFMKRHERDTQV